MKKDYSKRVIAFIDILGFKNIIEKSKIDKNVKERLFNVMQFLSNIRNENYDGILEEESLGKEVTVFSDSIVISYDVTFSGSIYYILMDIIHIQLEMANKGIYLRGGVTIGDLYHKKEILFGPGMVEAYLIESNKAKYPRIVVEEKVIEYAKMNPSPQHTSEQEMNYINRLLKIDEDELIFTNFLEQYQECDDYDIYNDMIQRIKDDVNRTIKSCNDEKILEKYRWLEKQLNSEI